MIVGASCTFNVTKHPTSGWIIQQLREAFPLEAPQKYLIFDRDQKFGFEVIAAVKATRIIPKQTSFRSPWQDLGREHLRLHHRYNRAA
jgi:hypothetical protein